jgi:DMSO/TMAO reductase YedYZ molybdopterin-dependent catalytic subunit
MNVATAAGRTILARGVFALLLLTPAAGRAAAQAPRPDSAATITVGGDVPRPVTLTTAELAKLPRRTVRASDHGKPPATYEGTPLAEVLRRAGLTLGRDLRGARLTSYVLVEAADGYRVVFALPELDSAFTDKVVLLADQVDGRPLPPDAGPLRLVVPDEKRAARWVRQVKAVQVVAGEGGKK